MEQLMYATFSIRLANSTEKKNIQLKNVQLANFDNGKDLLDYIESFFTEISEGIIKTEDYKGKKKFHLRSENKGYRVDGDDRCYYGFISSGISGEAYKIIELDTNKKKADVKVGDGAFKDVFFYFYIPKNEKIGYLVLQRKGNFGVKIALEKSFRRYIKNNQELRHLTFKLFNIMSGEVYEKMMNEGSLKQIELVKTIIPSSLEGYMNNNYGNDNKELEPIKGKLKTTISNKEKLPPIWKRYLDKIYRSNGKASEVYEIDAIDDQYDEVGFQLEYKGKKKSFYVIKQWKTQPDIDVTDEYRTKFGTKISIHNLAKIAQDTITDIFDIKPIIYGQT